MKKLIGILFLFSIISINTYSQIVWEEINTPNDIKNYSVAVANNGDIYLGNSKSDGGGGVIRSTNNGGSWEFIGLENYTVYSLSFNHEGNLLAGTSYGIFLYDLASSEWDQKFLPVSNTITINPGFNNTIFAGGDLWRSSDDGYTWQEIIETEGGVRDFAVLSQDTVYVGMKNYLGGIGGVSRSIDAGDTWEQIGLDVHYVATLGLNSSGDLYAGCTDHHHYGYGGVFKLEHGANTWDTLSFWPRITSMVITDEDIIYCGFYTTTQYQGGVIRSDDGGESWVIDTTGMGNIGVKDLVMDNNERLYALAGYTNTNLYRTSLPVSLEHQSELKPKTKTYCVPNPFSSRAKIYFDNPSNGSADLNIYSLNGEKIRSRKLNTSEIDQQTIMIERNNLKSGFYIYVISGKNYYSTGKIVITH